jgi:hypothetical protein
MTKAVTTAMLLVAVSWAGPAQSTEDVSTIRAFRQLRIGMTDIEAGAIMQRQLQNSCSRDGKPIEIVLDTQKLSYRPTVQGRISTISIKNAIDRNLELSHRNLFEEAKAAECWFGEPEKVDKTGIGFVKNGVLTEKIDGLCAVWRGGETTFCLGESIRGIGSFTATCSWTSQRELQPMSPSACPAEYIFCRRPKFIQGGGRF